MVKVTDSDFNKKLKGRENKIGQFTHFPVRCLEGVAVSEMKVGDLITINGKAVNLGIKDLATEVIKTPLLAVPKTILVWILCLFLQNFFY
jgi:hypothetical protein